MDDRWAPKVHPLDRLADVEDPFELMAEPVSGDPQVMLECMLEEFVWMGWNASQLESLFQNPGYPVLVALGEHFGEDEVRRRIQSLLARTGVLRFREVIAEPDEEEHEPEVSRPLRITPFRRRRVPA